MYNTISLWTAAAPVLPDPIFQSYKGWYISVDSYTGLRCSFAGPLAFAEDSGKYSNTITILVECRYLLSLFWFFFFCFFILVSDRGATIMDWALPDGNNQSSGGWDEILKVSLMRERCFVFSLKTFFSSAQLLFG